MRRWRFGLRRVLLRGRDMVRRIVRGIRWREGWLEEGEKEERREDSVKPQVKFWFLFQTENKLYTTSHTSAKL
jgi:hypothetical protein